MADWKKHYASRFKDNSFKEDEIYVCIEKIVEELNNQFKNLGLNDKIKLSNNYISLPNGTLVYDINKEKILFELRLKGQVKPITCKLTTHTNSFRVSILGEIEELSYGEFGLCDLIDFVIAKMLLEEF